MFQKRKKQFNNQAFTIIELLVVIMIIGLVSTLAIVSLQGARQRTRDAKRWSDIRTIQSAVELCINEGGGSPPAAPATWNGILIQTCGSATMNEFLASSSMPEPPINAGETGGCTNGNPPSGDCYMYCKDAASDAYLLYSDYEGNPPAGGLDGIIDAATYTAGTECVLSIDARPTGLPICNPVSGGTFCLGRLIN